MAKRIDRPSRYRDVAKILREVGALDEESSERLELWIGLRNVLVHGYASIDYGKLAEAPREVDELKEIAPRLRRSPRGRTSARWGQCMSWPVGSGMY